MREKSIALKEDKNLFYFLVILTILFERLSIYFSPREIHLEIFGIIIHHFWFGVIILVVSFLISEKSMHLVKLCLGAIGTGLICNELIFMLFGAGLYPQYWSLPSIIGMIFMAFFFFFFLQSISNFLLNKKLFKTKKN